MYEILFILLQLIIGIYLLLPVVNSLGAYLAKDEVESILNHQYDYAIIITAYKNIDLIDPLIESLLKQVYEKYHIYLIADNCGITKFNNNYNRFDVLIPPKPLNSKSKSINFAIDNFVKVHDKLIIFDSDNLVHPDFLLEINKYFNRGFIAVQGERVAKNLDTKIARLDAIGEMFYNYVDRYALSKIGASSTLAGSGMAFNVDIYKNLMTDENIYGGFDKILQGKLVYGNYRIAYAKKAIVYDEKITEASQLNKQRTRWIYTYFKYAKYGLKTLWKGIINGSFNQFYFGLNHTRPPLFILTLLSITILTMNYFYSPIFFIAWILFGLLFLVNFIHILRINKASNLIWLLLKKLPFFILSQIISLFKINKASKEFLETNNSKYITIENMLKYKNRIYK